MNPITPHQVRNVLNRLRGQWCAPPGTPRDIVDHIEREGLARFHEWPSGHWQITDRGNDWLAENPDPHSDDA